MQLAFIAGPHAIREISTQGDFDFALAHICEQDLDDQYGYNAYFREQRATGRDVILDNAAYEKGGIPMTIDELLPLIKHVRPTIIVAPDYYRNPDQTIKESREFAEVIHTDEWYSGLKVMGVAHGSTMPEVIECIKELREFCDFVAVSKLLYDDQYMEMSPTDGMRLALSRNKLCHTLENQISGCEDRPWFYLLGLGEPNEIIYHRYRDWIWGNDSTSCLVHGLHAIEIPSMPAALGSRRVLEKLDFFCQPTATQLALAKRNIHRMRERQAFRGFGP